MELYTTDGSFGNDRSRPVGLNRVPGDFQKGRGESSENVPAYRLNSALLGGGAGSSVVQNFRTPRRRRRGLRTIRLPTFGKDRDNVRATSSSILSQDIRTTSVGAVVHLRNSDANG